MFVSFLVIIDIDGNQWIQDFIEDEITNHGSKCTQIIVIQDKNQRIVARLFLLGQKGSGKSSIVKRYIYDAFSREYVQTMGLEYLSKSMVFTDMFQMEGKGSKVGTLQTKVQFWDPSGEERYKPFIQNYIKIKKVDGFILVYDAGDSQSLKNLKDKWLPLIHKAASPDKKMLLLQNKIDEDIWIDRNDVNSWVKGHKMEMRQVSARTNQNIQNSISEFVLEVIKHKYNLVCLKDVYLSLLLQINQDFDDDLLQEAIGLMIDL